MGFAAFLFVRSADDFSQRFLALCNDSGRLCILSRCLPKSQANLFCRVYFSIFVNLDVNIVKKLLFLLTLLLTGLVGKSQNPENLVQIDERAKLRYSETDILSMTPLQLAQVNFIYRNSYVINREKPCDVCPEIDLNSIDVSTMQRKAKTRARYYQTVPGLPIDLLSVEELERELKRIEQEFSASTPE